MEQEGITMTTGAYRRAQAVAYAHEWAYGRNPAYYDFSIWAETAPTSPPKCCTQAPAS